MVHLKILSGSKRNQVCTVGEFPCQIGRAPDSRLRLEEAGVWDRHLLLEVKFPDGFSLNVQSGAIANVNGQAVQQARLRNGDVIEIGSVKLQFWLGEVRQPPLNVREALTWAGLAALVIAQLALIWFLIR